ncbi:YccF domain-containing protein [Uniformispora flossi]|uniref:YccF domain-containing protein n=1 Tax=Uniformispora flossi TaxID=3390723 RepID=UPI003C2C1FA6
MKTVLNIIWLVLCGFWMAISYAVAGLICFVLFFLVITIPFGIAAFRMASYALWPFGRTVVRKQSAGVGSMLGNILWIILFGWWLAIGHLVTGFALCITIIGIPLGIASFKMIPISLTPLGHDIVSANGTGYATY